MKTELLPADDRAIAEAGAWILRGEVVGFPTETVYGLGANALNGEAVRKIFAAKGRPGDNPLIVHVSEMSQIAPLICGELPEVAARLAKACWPGPLTMILPKSDAIPDAVSAGLSTVGIRMPSHPVARALIDAAGVPIAAPSANRSGRPSPTTAAHVYEDMAGKIPLILDGGACAVGVESTVLDVTVTPPRVLRPGGVTPERIAEIAGACEVDGSVLRPLKEGEIARSPGMKYRHYAPKGHLTIVTGEGAVEKICALYDAQTGEKWILCLEGDRERFVGRNTRSLGRDANDAAANLFSALREMDELGAEHIYSEAVKAEGVGLAVMNRMGRAAAFDVVRT